jgi:hypothetical protein
MSDENVERVVELLEKSLMIKLYSLQVSQGDIAKMLNKRAAVVNEFLKPLAKREKR